MQVVLLLSAGGQILSPRLFITHNPVAIKLLVSGLLT